MYPGQSSLCLRWSNQQEIQSFVFVFQYKCLPTQLNLWYLSYIPSTLSNVGKQQTMPPLAPSGCGQCEQVVHVYSWLHNLLVESVNLKALFLLLDGIACTGDLCHLRMHHPLPGKKPSLFSFVLSCLVHKVCMSQQHLDLQTFLLAPLVKLLSNHCFCLFTSQAELSIQCTYLMRVNSVQ